MERMLISLLLSWLVLVGTVLFAGEFVRSRRDPRAIVIVFVLMMPVIIFVQGGRFMLYLMEINPPMQILTMYAKGAAAGAAATAIPMLLVFDKDNVSKSIRWGLVCATAWTFLPISILFLSSL